MGGTTTTTTGGNKAPTENDGEGPKRGHLAFVNANIYQAATLNKLLPLGFKIESEDIVKRSYEQKLANLRKAALA